MKGLVCKEMKLWRWCPFLPEVYIAFFIWLHSLCKVPSRDWQTSGVSTNGLEIDLFSELDQDFPELFQNRCYCESLFTEGLMSTRLSEIFEKKHFDYYYAYFSLAISTPFYEQHSLLLIELNPVCFRFKPHREYSNLKRLAWNTRETPQKYSNLWINSQCQFQL